MRQDSPRLYFLRLLAIGQEQFALHATPNTYRRLARGASNVCLDVENPTCSVPALDGREGLWPYDYHHAWQ